jgi:hypothetical protein
MGLGNGADQVVDTYVEPLKNRENGNVFGFAAHNPEEMLSYALDFLKKQVEKKKRELIY